MDLLSVISETVLLIFLFAAALMDFRSGQLSLWFLLGGAAAGLALQILNAKFSIKDAVYGILPAAILFLLALLTKQAVGYGDCALLFVAGMILGLGRTVLLFFLSLLFAGISSALLLLLKKKGRSGELAFAPFLFAGYVSVLFIS